MSFESIGAQTTGRTSQPLAEPSAISPSCDPAIRVANLSKCYQIYDAPRDRLKQFLMPRLQRLLGRAVGSYHRKFWALQDVSFEVAKGETVGIIGRNGAGKSTLLQIICGTLTPTAGTVETRGRVAALLELGAGFNPEFSGRENIFMNGAVLGMSDAQIEERFDDIAAFADIGLFLDQPVKTYSSGMYVRLAFAVQACVDPEILIVDEALSVGDIGFQYKCFKRMEQLRASGTTVLMVTHATSSILEYADRCIVLDAGRVLKDTSDVLAAVLAYEKDMLALQAALPSVRSSSVSRFSIGELRDAQTSGRIASLGEKRFGTARAIIESLSIWSPVVGEERSVVRSGEEIEFRFRILSAEPVSAVVVGVSLSRIQGGDVWGDNNLNAGVTIDLEPGETLVAYRVRLPISAGDYLVHCGLASLAGGDREELDQRRPAAKLSAWSPRPQVGVIFAPIEVSCLRRQEP
ncbi:MAG: ABC transporter ATP-binding protein [Sterolibacteriaceae bacterium]|uniref:ABC transporter ATP-binding protein n=1 Tax=Candidatus Methylophosphatis roskildensis TaxID=2899263 RepID=A0A9D7E5F3_9PROT|nr:ABC transporter ATP-binding protein [Candidatus Methylophosphatis roskildensis]MBK7234755.1 ABC transporter ATP-binding protein [Sterolibacteriaceae bacterium]